MKLDAKRIVLIVSVVASSTVLWAVTAGWLHNPDRFTSVLVILWPVLAFIGAGAITAVGFMLLKHPWDRLAVICASWATFMFFWPPNIWYISALLVFGLFWWIGAHDIRHDLTGRRTMRISITLGNGMTPILLGMFLMVSLGFYLLPSVQNTTIANISTTIQGPVESIYSNTAFNEEIPQLPAGAHLETPTQIGKTISQLLHTWLEPVIPFIPPILAFGLFLFLWSVSFILRFPAIWLGSALVSLLTSLGFVHIEEQDVKAQVLEL